MGPRVVSATPWSSRRGTRCWCGRAGFPPVYALRPRRGGRGRPAAGERVVVRRGLVLRSAPPGRAVVRRGGRRRRRRVRRVDAGGPAGPRRADLGAGRLAWTEEDEAGRRHPRDPHKRVETLRSSRHVEVLVGDVVVAASERPVLLLETDLPTRYYLPREDVRLRLLRGHRQPVGVPLQGDGRPLLDLPGPPEVANVAWSYSSPLPAVGADRGPDRLLQRARRPARRRRPARAAGVPVQQGRAASGRGVTGRAPPRVVAWPPIPPSSPSTSAPPPSSARGAKPTGIGKVPVDAIEVADPGPKRRGPVR